MTKNEFKGFIKSKGISYTDIAKVRGVSASSVRNSLSKAEGDSLPKWAASMVHFYKMGAAEHCKAVSVESEEDILG